MATIQPEATRRPRDAQATQRRLLTAAIDEFSERGLAGARVDRIADRAGANKRLIYNYFGTKDELFDAVLAQTVGVLTESVPFTPEDLPAYAGALFDELVLHPKALRLATWRNFERSEVPDTERDSYRKKLAQIKAAQRAGHLDPAIPAADVLAMLMSLVTSWLGAPAALRATGGGADPLSPRRLSAHRRALVTVVSRMATPVDD